MSVSNVQLIDAYAQMSAQAYRELMPPKVTPPIQGPDGVHYIEIYSVSSAGDTVLTPIIDGADGFQAHAFYNTQRNELVVAFSGTEGLGEPPAYDEFIRDAATDLTLAVGGFSTQILSGRTFVENAKAAAAHFLQPGFSITYIGHSLGGFSTMQAGSGWTCSRASPSAGRATTRCETSPMCRPATETTT